MLPESLKVRLQSQLGEQFDTFDASLQTSAPTSIRVNPNKDTARWDENRRLPWCNSGRYLPTRPNFTLDPLFHAGTYYVQEASSMFISHILESLVDLRQELRVLDLSAAPGGKATLVNSMISPSSLLVANEVISKRNKILQHNVAKWGHDNVIITQSDPRFFKKLPDFFDVVLVDAPCSGEGLFRKEPSAVAEWSLDNVQLCAARQRRILADVYPALAPGGLLIYSTCTFSEAENEENVEWLKKESGLEVVEIDFPKAWGIQTHPNGFPGYRFYPHRVEGEGFYVAILRKDTGATAQDKHPRGNQFRTGKVTPEDQKWLAQPERYGFLEENRSRVAIPKQLLPAYQIVDKALRITSAGITMGRVYPNGLQPAAELALSTHLSPQINRAEVSSETALDFLSHRNLELPQGLPPGRHLITYQGYGLGWINKLGNGQVRNNYPAEWRILKRD